MTPEQRDQERLDKIRELTDQLELPGTVVVFVAQNVNQKHLALKGPTPLQVALMAEVQAILLVPNVQAYYSQPKRNVVPISGPQAQEIMSKLGRSG